MSNLACPTDSVDANVVFARFMELPQGDRVQAEYIWLGGSMAPHDIRSKTKTLDFEVKNLSQLPVWNFDGSSTGQAPGKDSEVYLKPVKMLPDPFRGGKNILVLCECTLPDKALTAIPSNSRRAAAEMFAIPAIKDEEPWFGIEQEYTLFKRNGVVPLGWPENGYPAPQGPYYCSNGQENAFGRCVVEAHYRCCLNAGITISGVNAEVMPGQWEYQVGPCVGIDGADQLVLSRYLMLRVCEAFGVRVSFDPKPIPGDWNGAGAHTNFSTKSMRADGGYTHVIKALEALGKHHAEHIDLYGKGNDRRLTGAHETAPIDKFSYGVANRGASCRIPRTTEADKKGYFEDRRPASNMDPYLVTSKLVETCILRVQGIVKPGDKSRIVRLSSKRTLPGVKHQEEEAHTEEKA